MRIISVAIKDLFGKFNYSINVNNDITIIHGPNGCGKTTVLRIIDSVFNGKLDSLRGIDFSDVTFTFDDETVLQVIRKKLTFANSKTNDDFYALAYCLTINGQERFFDAFEKLENVDFISTYFQRHRVAPFIDRISEDLWIDRRDDIKMTTEELISKYGHIMMRRIDNAFDDITPKEVQAILSMINIKFISSDRLTVQKKVERQYGEDGLKIEQRVDVIAQSISKLIKESIQKYAQISQSKDRTFPLRVIKETNPLSIEQIKSRLIELENKRKELVDNGILEEENDIDMHELFESITAENRSNLSLYAIDTEAKLNVLTEISNAINLFRTLIENDFANKRIIFSKDEGFVFVTDYSHKVIKPSSLSSGEQHELVMFYDLIFETTQNTLILIDEPELSLHIKWQLEYIAELRKIIGLSHFHTLIATHSPQIIHDNWDITISLAEEE